MYVLALELDTTPKKEKVIDKRFRAKKHVLDVMVKHAKKLLKKLKHDKEYQNAGREYGVLKSKKKLNKNETARRKELADIMNTRLKEIGLTDGAFKAYLKVCGKMYNHCLSSQQVQKIAVEVWSGVEAVLFGNGKDIHFTKLRDINTISGASNTNGARFDKNALTVSWIRLTLKCKEKKDLEYMNQALKGDISYCEIKRMMFPNGWHYYAMVVMKGDAPKKIKEIGSNKNITGIDIGTSTVATVSDDMTTLKELAPDIRKYNEKIKRLLTKMDASRRAMNPGKYKPDGMINKANKDRWVYSKTYLKNENRLKSLYRRKAAYIKQSHEEMINRLLKDSTKFVVEKMSFSGLQKRGKKTERSDKVSEVKQKDGTVKKIKKYKKKKRFGRSLNNRAPAEFVEILKRKAALYGGVVYEADTIKYRASQYDHVEDKYNKPKLKEREKIIGGHKVQRDLYSAFLLKNTNDELNGPDRNKCIKDFENFLRLEDETITKMKEDGISMKQCFGF